MKRICILLLLSGILAHGGMVSAAPRLVEPDFAALDAYIEDAMQRDRVPGLALAMVRNDQVVYAHGYGTDGNGGRITPQTGFILGSMSKSFTALAVMQLVERGELVLDAPVQRYLPWFRVADPQASAAITLRQLLNHTSGIAQQAPAAALTLQGQVRALATVALTHAPGTTHAYASPNYLVLGAVIEQVTGQSYAAFIEQNIFAPLQMQHSFTDQQAAQAVGMSRGHRYWFGYPVATTLRHESERLPTAALISSAADVGNYLIAQLNEGRYETTSVLTPSSMAQVHAPSAPGDGFDYAFGWRISTIGGVTAVHHGGIVPHFRGKMVLLPAQRWGIVVLTNASTSSPLPIVPTSHRLADTIAAYLAGQPLPEQRNTQSQMFLAASIGMGLVVVSQLKGLFWINRWRTSLGRRSRRAAVADIALEFFWPLFAVFGLPLVLGLPWREIMRGTPDLATWLGVSVVLGLLTGGLKVAAFRYATGGWNKGRGA